MGGVVELSLCLCISSVEFINGLFIGSKFLLDLELVSVVEVCLEIAVFLPPRFDLVGLVSREKLESLAFLLFGFQIYAEPL